MLIKILIGVAVLLALLVVVIALRPTHFRITRKTKISAPPATVFGLINDLKRWQAWSPWEKLDPNMQRTYEGPSSGPGAVYGWVGNGNVGEGRMTIVDSQPHKRVDFSLQFIKPFAATNSAEFVITPVGDQTEVTWSMEGDYNFVMKACGLVMNMDKICGGQFEEGLANMKQAAESQAKVGV